MRYSNLKVKLFIHDQEYAQYLNEKIKDYEEKIQQELRYEAFCNKDRVSLLQGYLKDYEEEYKKLIGTKFYIPGLLLLLKLNSFSDEFGGRGYMRHGIHDPNIFKKYEIWLNPKLGMWGFSPR